MLELGQEGCVVGAYVRGVAGAAEEARILVQFAHGVSWWLAPGQLVGQAAYAFARSRGVSTFNWGTRVRSLVSYLNPPGGRRDLFLGDAGTVIGPGTVPGKVAVRFDEHGEWSIWPRTICEASAYAAAVAEALPGSFYRGDRVKAKGQLRGRRSVTASVAGAAGAESGGVGGGASSGAAGDAGDAGDVSVTENEPKTLTGEELGTVIGPGHASTCVLVHFDSDENVWSMVPEQLEPIPAGPAASGDGPAAS